MTADPSEPTGLPARTYSSYTAPGMYHTMKLRYGEDNPGEVESTFFVDGDFKMADPLQCIRHLKIV